MESLGGLNDVSEKDEMKEEKVVNLDEEKKKRKPFWYWTVKGMSSTRFIIFWRYLFSSLPIVEAFSFSL